MDLKDCESCEPSNNKFFGCPPLMSDGRHFTDYRPRCNIIHDMVKREDKNMSSYEYRQYLISNADSIMEKNRSTAIDKMACAPCKEPYEVGTMLPEKEKTTCNMNTCATASFEPSGLGRGRNFGTFQPTYDEFLSLKKQADTQWMSWEDAHGKNLLDTKYYSVEGLKQNEINRPTIPSGTVL